MLIGAGAASGFLQVRADVVVFTAVHDGEDVVQPVAKRPETEPEQWIRLMHIYYITNIIQPLLTLSRNKIEDSVKWLLTYYLTQRPGEASNKCQMNEY